MRVSPWLAAALFLTLAGCGGEDGTTQPTVVTTQPTVVTLTSLTVTAQSVSVAAGARQSIGAQGIGSDGKAMTGVNFTYSSASPGIAFVSSNGAILGLAAGTSAITVTGTSGGVSKATTVNVTVTGALATAAAVVAGANSNDFQPNLVAVARGGTVTWTFPGITHNATFAAAAGAPANIPNTGNQVAGVPRTFATAGTFNYDCTLHAGMTGTVVVP